MLGNLRNRAYPFNAICLVVLDGITGCLVFVGTFLRIYECHYPERVTRNALDLS